MSTLRAESREWGGLIVLCATNRYDGVRMSDWHLAQHLTELAPVLYVDPPVSRLTPVRNPELGRLRRCNLRLRRQGARLARLTPVVQPFPCRPGTVGITSTLTRRYLARAISRLGGNVLALVTGWPQYSVFGSCSEQVRVYWAKDDFVGGAALLGLNARIVDKRERDVADGADLLVAANPIVAKTWCDRGLNPLLVPFGTNASGYLGVEHAPLPADVNLAGPVAGFVGRINTRTDLRLLEAVADRGRSLLLVGPKDPAFEPGRFEALLQRPNVQWVGLKPSEALPSYLRIIDVGLVPYRDSRFNRGSFPLKTLEYVAAGRPVVATDLPAIRWLATDLICIAEPASFADQVDRWLAEPRTAAIVARRQAFAAEHSWKRRAAEVYEAIASLQRRLEPKQVLK
jgi:teichuronic acid biosynthesis glycosyltransferase TuaH